MEARNELGNLKRLGPKDEVKVAYRTGKIFYGRKNSSGSSAGRERHGPDFASIRGRTSDRPAGRRMGPRFEEGLRSTCKSTRPSGETFRDDEPPYSPSKKIAFFSCDSPRAGRGAKGLRAPSLRRPRLRDVSRARQRWGWTVHALSFDYGQRHSVELRAARALARRSRRWHRVIAMPSLGALGGSALTDRWLRVPKKALGKARIPVAGVQARNTLFLAFALGAAETSGARGDGHRRDAATLGLRRISARVSPGIRARCEPRDEGGRRGAAALNARAAPAHDEGGHRPSRAALALDPGLTTSCYDPYPARKAVRRVRLVPAARERLRRGRRDRSPGALTSGPAMRRRAQGAGEEIARRLLGRLKIDGLLELGTPARDLPRG